MNRNLKKRISYGKQTITEEDIARVTACLESDFITQGPTISEFEEMVASYHGAKYAVAFSNGTAALHGAYASLNLEPGSEVITSPITFVATPNAAIYCGHVPIFADIDPDTNCIDIEEIKKKVTKRTKVISPISFAGYPVDLRRIREIADYHGCYVVHDAAHAIGSRRDGTFGMEYADLAILSFHPVKHITTGEGGMVLTNNEELYQRMIRFRSHGITKDSLLLKNNDGPWYYEMMEMGFNYRMTDIQATLGIGQFSRIKENLRDRNLLAKAYNKVFDGNDVFDVPPDVGFKFTENDCCENIHSYHLYTIRMKDSNKRRAMYDYLHARGVLAQIHYIPVHLQPFYREHYGYKQGDYPAAEDFYCREISIPMFHCMSDDDREYVIDSVLAFKK